MRAPARHATEEMRAARRRFAIALAVPTFALAIMLFAPLSPAVSAGPTAAPTNGSTNGRTNVRVTTPQPAASSGPVETLDWPHVLRVGDITYTAGLLNSGRPLREDDLGREVARVTRRLNGTVKPTGYEIKDGEAAYLAPGTTIYAVNGYATTFRVAAHQAGSVVLFEAFDSPSARIGRDILDIDGRVQSVVVDENDPRAAARTIARTEDVAALVRMVLESRLDRGRAFGHRTAYVSFRLVDGTAVTFQYAAADAMLSRGIVDLPAEFRRLIESP